MSGTQDRIKIGDTADATVARGAMFGDSAAVTGRYTYVATGPIEARRTEYVKLRDKIEAIKRWLPLVWPLAAASALAQMATIPIEQKWVEVSDNIVVTVGKNEILDKAAAGSGYTATWYMGLISSASYTTGVVAGDTMGTHGGWLEAGAANAPTYSQANRVTTAWSAAAGGAKSLSSALTFSITGTGTVKGGFITTVSTKDGATGILISGNTFTGGDKVLGNGDTLSVSYTLTLT
jgi:hypothetical protein